MNFQITLDYTIPCGDLTPYFDALSDARALATTCIACGHVAFPARTSCLRCAGQQINWTELPGTARVLYRTVGPTGSFALVRFDGADTNSTVALVYADTQEELEVQDTQTLRGSLMAPPKEQPGLWLLVSTNNTGKDDEY